MKSYLLLIILLFFSIIGFSQSKKELLAQITTLTAEKQKLLDEKQKLMDDFLNLKQQIIDLKTDNLNCKSENEQLRTKLTTSNNTSANPSSLGIINKNTSSSQTNSGRCQAITAKGTQCSRNAEPGSKYCWQHQGYIGTNASSGQNFKSTTGTTKSSGTTTSGKTIITGPRGGKYYINKNGNKTYIKK